MSGLLAAGLALAASPRPNIVMLLADDLGWQDLGCYGGPVHTSVVDQLAADGIRFTDFYAGAAVCSPSRATLLTGRQHLRAGVYSWIHDQIQRAHLPVRETTLAEILKTHGYATAHIGKWHLGMPTAHQPKPTPDDHGFDYWFATANNAYPSHRRPANFLRNGRPVGPVEGYACQILVDEAIVWLDRLRGSERPFFLNLWFHEPHAPLAAPADLVAAYGDLKDPAAIYSAAIENTDRAIGRLLAHIRTLAPPENTVVVYASDNGSYRADRGGGLRGIKGSNFEGGIRVPGIGSWPGAIPGGRIATEPAGLVDLLPTVCGLLDVEKPKGDHLDGADLSPILTGRTEAFSRPFPMFWFLPTASPALAIRDGDYGMVAYRDYDLPKDRNRLRELQAQIEALLLGKGKLDAELRGSTMQAQLFEGFIDTEAERLRGGFIRLNMFQESWIPIIKAGGFQGFQLFNLVADPGQRTNLIGRQPEIAARMERQLLDLVRSTVREAPAWDPPPEPANGPVEIH